MLQRYLLTIIVTVLCAFQIQASAAASNETIEHIVIIWLKQPGNIHAQDTVIKASQALKSIPGVISLKAAVNDFALAGYGLAAFETDYARYAFQCLAGLYDGVLRMDITGLFQPDNDDVFDCFI